MKFTVLSMVPVKHDTWKNTEHAPNKAEFCF